MITSVQIFNWIIIGPAAFRNLLISDLIPGGMKNSSTCLWMIWKRYCFHIQEAPMIHSLFLSPKHKFRLRGLLLLIDDLSRSNQDIGFNKDINCQSFSTCPSAREMGDWYHIWIQCLDWMDSSPWSTTANLVN